MTPEKAYNNGVRYADTNVTERRDKRRVLSTVWEVWVPNDMRPNGRQVLTEGGVATCAQWVGVLRRIEQRA